ncbi:vWA domain-containing protein [Noviluteimonas gilva]|uniref:VWA domain-containing protein n=1 Tax=Noviluteimonas gilva TaxID=2682097 RepID=A0A7C9HK74_9GAMM|nr:VWA domain-containing protein [Lysobacter gilvus]MUV12657.1 VWA domain-containing protein [Lysobacter gilvus]
MNPLHMSAIDTLHFLRPSWLWALLALPVIAWLWWQRGRRDNVWRASVDAHLLPWLLEPASNVRTRSTLVAVLLAFTLAVLALAGPAWKQVAQPAWQSRTPLVVALDLSSSALAADLPPSRLLQARAKLATLLRERAGGQVGLLAFADDAYTVAPLTDDAANVALFLDSLSPDVMPIDGHRPDRAITRAVELMRQAGFDHGDILVLTDHGDAAANAAASQALKQGMRVSVLGLGSEEGTVVQQVGGGISRVSLDPASLRSLASAGGGRFATLSIDDADLRALGVLTSDASGATSTQGRAGRSWEDAGYWLIPPLMLLAVFAFRRGAGVAAMLLVLCVPMGFAQAQEAPKGTLWRRADQVAAQRMEAGESAYRAGKFDAAANAYDGLPGADAQYNHGNALAKQGQYEAAIAAYDRALRAQPNMPDAIANRRAVEAAMKRKPPSGGSKRNDPRSQGKQDGKQQQQQQSGQSQSQQQQQQQQAQQQSGQNGQPQQSPAPQQSGQQPKPSEQAGDSQQKTQAQAKPQSPKQAEAQRAADAAQRERMQRALGKGKDGKPQKGEAQARAETPQERERRLANEAWLRRVPDDPGGLLRAKFRLEYERRQLEGGE